MLLLPGAVPCPRGAVRTLFAQRHIGPNAAQIKQQLAALNLASLDELAAKAVPGVIRGDGSELRGIPEPALSEMEALQELRGLAAKNKVLKCFLGQGYYNTFTPPVIQRNMLENPQWYTAYTPYQAEISQGRLEVRLSPSSSFLTPACRCC
jgi:glycine dehydrogenase